MNYCIGAITAGIVFLVLSLFTTKSKNMLMLGAILVVAGSLLNLFNVCAF